MAVIIEWTLIECVCRSVSYTNRVIDERGNSHSNIGKVIEEKSGRYQDFYFSTYFIHNDKSSALRYMQS